MSKKLISFKIVKDFLENTAGEHALKFMNVQEKLGKKFNDEQVAEKMKLKVTQVRTILSRLHYRGISNYQKTRNKKTGWYSYTWEINRNRIVEILVEEQEEMLRNMKKRKNEVEGHSLFMCGEANCEALPFEVAAEYNFRCPSCGKVLEPVNSEKMRKEQDKQIKKIEKLIKDLKEAK